MIGRLGVVLAVAAVVLSGCASISQSGLPSDTRCGHSSRGVVCIVVQTADRGVDDLIGYYSPGRSLTGRTWRLELVRYDCDPGASSCITAARYPGPSRTAPPPVDGTCIAVLYDSGRQKCLTRLAQQMASIDDWSGLPRLPLRSTSATWWCVTAQVRTDHVWRDEFPPASDCYRVPATAA